MSNDGRVVGDPTEVLTRSGGTGYVSLTADVPPGGVGSDSGTPTDGPAQPVSSEPVATKRRLQFIGWIAFALAVASAVLTAVGVGSAAGGEFVTGTVLAWVAIGVSGVAVLGAILALIAGFGRLPAALAIVLGLLANPFLLTQLLGAVETLGAASAATS